MAQASTAKTDTAETAKPKTEAKTAAPKTLLVLDTTAVDAPRLHEQVVAGQVKRYTFQPGVGLKLSYAEAVKFLKHDGFKLVGKDGEIIPYVRAPKQPEELQAGERLTLSENETIARYEELSDKALMARALELPGGEKFAQGGARRAVIDFIITVTKERREANKAKAPDIGKDEFVPEPEVGDDTPGGED